MKDEEMAKEYSKSACAWIEDREPLDERDIQQAFLAGLKAGRPQWHDLRKDPKDLPKDNNEVLVYMWDSYYIGYFNLNSWHFENFSEGKEQADAWCEIPTFDKE
jgi:hypothetical protein